MNEVERWLEGLGLAGYAPAFSEQHVEFDLLADLGDDDLKQLGVEALGHRKRLLRAIAALAGAAIPVPIAPLAVSPAAVYVARDAERRQLTVMFCDLVGSTVLSRKLDPEDLQRLLLDYHARVAAAVAPYAGHVARFLGDGVLVYFGFPQAHEDDAARAVRAALSILAELRSRTGEIVLQARIGIATGLVVVGEIGTGTAAAEHVASGETPNLAARLQAQARPGEIVVSVETRELLGQAFALESLGALDLKGLAAPIEAWRVVGEHRVATRFEAQHMQGLVEFIGRESEIALLLERWALAREGEGQAVVLSGEAGLGKSRICQSLRERLAEEPVATVLLQCSPYFSSSALYPIVQHLERTAGMATGDAPEVRAYKLGQLAGALPSAALGCLLRLVGLPDGGGAASNGASPQEEKAHTLEALIELLRQLSQRQPVLFLVEDAHWIDPTTDELLGQLVQQLREQRVLLLVTCRPQYTPAWGGAGPLTRHSLSRLSQRQCTALVGAVAGKSLPAEVLAEIIRKTDGIPLFVEELTKTVLQSGLLQDTPAGYQLSGPLPSFAIPSTLQDSLMARLDRLAPAKEVAQVGSVIGREFGHQLLAEVLKDMPGMRLDAGLADLVQAELVFRRGTPPEASYSFKHALVRDAAYNSMLKSQRILRHLEIAAALERDTGQTAKPELLAYHHQEAGNAVKALRHWQAAGNQAMERSAIHEAVAHYEAAAGLLEIARSVEPCDEVELDLRMKLANATVRAEGFNSPQAHAHWYRARELAVVLNRPDEQLQACSGIAAYLGAIGQPSASLKLMEDFAPELLNRTNPMGRASRLIRISSANMLQGRLAVAETSLIEARRELEDVKSADRRPVASVDPLVPILLYLAQVQKCRGRLSLHEANAEEGLRVAEDSQLPNGRIWAMGILSHAMQTKGDWQGSIALSKEGIQLAKRYGVKAHGAQVTFWLGRALVATGDVDAGFTLLCQGSFDWKRFGGRFWSTSYPAFAAEVLIDAGRVDDAMAFLLDGEQTMGETGENYQAANFLGLRGRLAERQGDQPAAERSYRLAVQTAELQGAHLYSLRAATLMARLFQSQGRFDEASAALQPIYDKFTEGFDWPDLVRAKAVLESGG